MRKKRGPLLYRYHLIIRMLVVLIAAVLFLAAAYKSAAAQDSRGPAGYEGTVESLVWEDSALPALPLTGARPGRETRDGERVRRAYQPDLTGKRFLSRLEKFYSRRAGETLRQFGYRALGGQGESAGGMPVGREGFRQSPRGSVPGDFVLGPGDEVRVVLTGQKTSRKVYEIDHEGRLIIDEIGMVPAAGRKISDIRKEITALASARHNIDIFVSLDTVRQIHILVIGHVGRPGRQRISAFDTLLDALMAAGGVEKSGSLRNLTIVRDGTSQHIDLYNLFFHENTQIDLRLEDGDRVIVPPIGPTLAVAGSVTRPGIYEMASQNPDPARPPGITAAKALSLSGGLLARGNNRLLSLSVNESGREITRRIPADETTGYRLRDATVLLVERQTDKQEGEISLSGHTTAPGRYDVTSTPTLSSLLKSPAMFGPDIYPLLGVIKRKDPDNLGRDWIGFAPYLVTSGQLDRRLEDGDVIRLFSSEQMRKWMALKDSELGPDGDNGAQQSERDQGRTGMRPVSYIFAPEPGPLSSGPQDIELKRFLKDYGISVRGAVRHPGLYPAAENISLKALLSAAGGLVPGADKENIEIQRSLPLIRESGKSVPARRARVDLSRTARPVALLGPGDSVTIRDSSKDQLHQEVVIKGEVAYPGSYTLASGDTLLDLIERAGGLTDQAYPDGTIFSRADERRRQKQAFQAQARDLELTLARQLEKREDGEDDAPGAKEIKSVRRLIARLRQARALGRITVEADPAVLKTRPDLNILLEAGDKIYIPKRPLHVRVRGEVLSPASLQFRKNNEPDDYIRQAGGFSQRADDDRSFVIFPDGSAQPLDIGHWSHDDTLIPPGSTIVVPLDADRFSFVDRARDLSQILANLTISTIFLADIYDD